MSGVSREKGNVSESLNQVNASPLCFNVDDDSLTEILARLPAKSAIRFKLVCKSWLSLISSDCFRRLHALCKPPPSLILTTLKRDPISSKKKMVEISELCYDSNQGGYIKTSNEKQRMIPFDDNVSALSCCCNGLLLLRNRIGYFHVYNPTTNHSQIIPFGYWFKQSVHLVFDPFKSQHDYKIVCFHEIPVEIFAFDSVSGKWSKCVEGFTNGDDETCSSFYLIHKGLLYCFNNVFQFIVCPLPKLADRCHVDHYELQESNGCLYYCAFVGNVSSNPSALLWELQLNGGRAEWLLKYHHTVPCSSVTGGVYMLAFISETSTILIRVQADIMAYSFRDKSYKEQLLPNLELFTKIHCIVHVDRNGETPP